MCRVVHVCPASYMMQGIMLQHSRTSRMKMPHRQRGWRRTQAHQYGCRDELGRAPLLWACRPHMIRHVGLDYKTLAHGCISPWRFWLRLMNLLIAGRRHRCDLSNRMKMIGMIRNMSVYKLHSLEMCGVILVLTPRGDIKGPPKTQQTIKQHIKAFSRHSKHDESSDTRHQTTTK